MAQRIEAPALQTPPLSVAPIHRQVLTLAAAQGTPAPCYRTVYNIIRRIAPALRTLAHHGSKAYHETFDLLYRREAVVYPAAADNPIGAKTGYNALISQRSEGALPWCHTFCTTNSLCWRSYGSSWGLCSNGAKTWDVYLT
jgi:hypothetical protein